MIGFQMERSLYIKQVADIVREDYDFIRLIWCDMHGICRVKMVPAEIAAECLPTGISVGAGRKREFVLLIYTYTQTCMHTHTHTHIYIYMCVCVCILLARILNYTNNIIITPINYIYFPFHDGRMDQLLRR